MLCPQGTQQGGKRLAPLFAVTAQALKILLEGQAHLVGTAAQSHHLCNRLNYRIHSAMERAPLHQIRVIAVGHGSSRSSLSPQHRQLCYHALRRGKLVLAAKRHQHAVAADGRVKTLCQPLLAAYIQILQVFQPCLFQIRSQRSHLARNLIQVAIVLIRCLHHQADMLPYTVGIKEITAQVDNGILPPVHHQAAVISNHSHYRSLKVFLVSSSHELLHVITGNNYSHALLGLGNSQLGAIQALVLLLDGIQVNHQSVSQLADGNGHAACTKVVATLDHAADFRIPEQALNLSLRRRIALLHFGTAGSQGFQRMLLGRAGSTATAITAGTAAYQHDNIIRRRNLADHVHLRSCCNYGTDFHALGQKALMIYLGNLSGSQSDLIAVGAVTGCCPQGNLLLRQLALQGLTDRTPRVSGTSHAHGLINIGTAGQWVADGTAQAGSSAAERLNLSRMVMGFVLEHNQPVLVFAINVGIDNDAAGINLVRLVQVLQLALLPESLHADNSQVHQGNIPFLTCIQILAVSQVLLVGILNRLAVIPLLNIHQINGGSKGGMTAMVRPVGINNPDFGNGRLTLLSIPEILLAELQILKAHSKAAAIHELLQCCLIHLVKALQHLYISRCLELHVQGIRLFHGCLPALHGIDIIILNLLHSLGIHIAHQHHYTGGSNLRTLLLGNQLHALGSGVSSLVVLARQVLHSKHSRIREARQLLLVDNVHRRLRENHGLYLSIFLVTQPLNVIAVEQAYCLQTGQAEALHQVIAQLLGRNVEKALSLFYKNSSYTH